MLKHKFLFSTLLAFLLLIMSCKSVDRINLSTPANDSEEDKEGSASQLKIEDKRFDILTNDGETLVVDVRGLEKVSKSVLSYSLVIDEHLVVDDKGNLDNDKLLKLHTHDKKQNGLINDSLITIDTASNGSGTYTFKIYKGKKVVLEQDVYVVVNKGWPARLRNEQSLDQIALKYSPIVMFNEQEEYFPASIPYLVNKKSPTDKEPPTPKVDKETYKIRGRIIIDYIFKRYVSMFNKDFRYIMDRLPYWGDRRTSLNLALIQTHNPFRSFRYRTRSLLAKNRKNNKKDSTIYYSFLREYKRDSNGVFSEKDRYFLFYHFLYTFDPKDGKAYKNEGDGKIFGLRFRMATGHIFDRESMAIVFEGDESGKLNPVEVVYGAHLAGQAIGLLDRENEGKFLQEWNNGRIKIAWTELKSTKIYDHPVISIAKGSHAVYPFPGTYNITKRLFSKRKYKLLGEVAGPTTEEISPNVLLQEEVLKGNSIQNYKLLSLKIGRHISADPHYGFLVYSGSLVDLPMPITAQFPPFTDRERNPVAWVDGAKKWKNNVSNQGSEKMVLPELPGKIEDYLKSLKERIAAQD